MCTTIKRGNFYTIFAKCNQNDWDTILVLTGETGHFETFRMVLLFKLAFVIGLPHRHTYRNVF